MKPFLAALSCLLALSPAFAQEAPHPCDKAFDSWRAAFNQIDASYKALDSGFKKGDPEPDKFNDLCKQSAGDALAHCGAVVDHAVLVKSEFVRQGSLWAYAGNTVMPDDDQAVQPNARAAFSRLCGLRRARQPGARGAAASTQDAAAGDRAAAKAQESQAAAEARTKREVDKIIAENRGSAVQSAPPPAPGSGTDTGFMSGVHRFISSAKNAVAPDLASENVASACDPGSEKCWHDAWLSERCDLAKLTPTCRAMANSHPALLDQ